MKRFIFKIGTLVSTVLITLYIINFYYNPFIENNYIYALHDKYSRYKHIDSPKLLFIGGSSLAFGINSKEIEDSLIIPVVNMGMHAGLGILYYLNLTKLTANKGDIVIWSFEQMDIYGANSYKAIAYQAVPEIFSCLPFTEKLNFVWLEYANFTETNKKLFVFFANRKCISPIPRYLSYFSYLLPIELYINPIDSTKFVYERRNFNNYGDVYTHLTKPAEDTALGALDTLSYRNCNDELTQINEYSKELIQKGVKVYYYFPPYANSRYKINHLVVDSVGGQYIRGLTVPILNSISEVIYPDSLFYNTAYHLNKIGRELNTRKVIALLKPIIEK